EPLGIGSSARPQRADYSLTAQADRIAGVLDSLGIRQAFVIAHSLGGAEGFRLAYRRPDLVRGLISLEGGPTEAAITPAFKRAGRRTRATWGRPRCGCCSAPYAPSPLTPWRERVTSFMKSSPRRSSPSSAGCRRVRPGGCDLAVGRRVMLWDHYRPPSLTGTGC